MKKLTFHLGLHRCASTTVQNILRRGADVVARQRATGILRHQMEDNQPLNLLSWYRRGRGHPAMWGAQKRFCQMVDAMPFDHVIVSEENLIGTMPGMKDFLVYPRLDRFLAHIAPLKNRYDLRLRFLVRRQDRFLESIYAFRVSRGLTLGFDAFQSGFAVGAFDWNKVNEVCTTAGLADFTKVAALEDFTEGSLYQNLMPFLGLEPADIENMWRSNQSLPDAALRVMLAVNRAGLFRDRRARKEQLMPLLLDQDTINPAALADLLTAAQMREVTDHFTVDETVSFTEEARRSFLAGYQPDRP